MVCCSGLCFGFAGIASLITFLLARGGVCRFECVRGGLR